MHRTFPFQAYLVAMLTTAAVAVLRRYVLTAYSEDAPLFLFFLPVTLGAWLGNWKTGLITTVVCVLLGTSMFIEHDGWYVPNSVDRIIIFRFLLVGVILSWLFESRGAAQRRLLASLSQMRGTQAQLDAVSENLRLVTQCMAAPVTRCSRDMRYMWVSQPYADWLGKPTSELIGRSIVDCIGQAAFERLLPSFERVLTGQRVECEELVDFGDRGQRFISAIYTPTFDRQGQPDGWVAVVNDITAEKRIEQALKDNDRRKDEFLAMLGHELRNPLAAMSSSIAAWPLVKAQPALAEQLVARVERQSRHLVQIVDELLDVSRITRGKITLQRRRVDLRQVLSEAAETAEPLIRARRHTLNTAVPAEPVWIEGDAVRLVQVFANLLHNAAKFTPPGGNLAIELSGGNGDGHAVVEVRDNGAGIAPHLLTEIFELFRQADPTPSRIHGGLGIGLTVVKQIVELHGGRVAANSEGLGRGSAFAVFLPRVAGGPDNNVDHLPPIVALDHASSRRRVLIIDDAREAGESLATLLELHGHQVVVAQDGASGISAVLAQRPDIALIDIGMPDMDGFEVARRLRARVDVAHTRLVALTGYGGEDMRRKTQAAGFDGHLTKPTRIEELEALLRDLPRQQAVEVSQ